MFILSSIVCFIALYNTIGYQYKYDALYII